MRGFSSGLWLNRDFMKLWAGQMVSQFGSRITRDGLPLTAVLVLAATPTQLGLLGALQAIPVLLIGLFAGVWVDRFRLRPILIWADIGRALALGSIPVAAIFGFLTVEQLYLVAALVGVLSVFFQVADQSYLPNLIDREQIVEGNSKLGTTESLAEIGGPPLAGVLIQVITAPLAIALDALSFLFSAICIGLIRKPEPKLEPVEEGQNIWQEIVEGLKYVWQNPIQRALTLSTATHNFFGSFLGTLYSVYAIRELGLTPALLGLVIGTGGIGALLGALFTGRFTRRFGIGRAITIAVVVGGLFQLAIPLAGGPVLVATLCLIAGQVLGDVWLMVFSINEVSLRQRITPPNLLGRANASVHFLTGAIQPFGLLTAGILAEIIGMRLTILISTTGLLLSALWVIFSPVPRLKAEK